jgi:DeoR family fructose operon transcriptional repressor
LTAQRDINIIFAINDISAWGAIKACQDLGVDPDQLIVLTFGLEGDRLKNVLMEGTYCKAGLAMFPEIVGPVCVEAAIAIQNNQALPGHLVTPYTILTPQTLPDIYTHTDQGWELRWDVVRKELDIPLELTMTTSHPAPLMPRRIGFIVPFMEHEWYQNLRDYMRSYAGRFGIEIEIVDVDEDLADEMDLRRREIARQAGELVQPGEVILVDGGPLGTYLAEELKSKESLTIITNSMPVFDVLRQNPENILISTGGAYRHSSQVLVGPQAEGALHELRADKLFLMVAGISFSFGLSHTNISEVTIKQAMIRSAREVILLADHTLLGQESTAQVAPLSVVNTLITDDALPASTRLDLTQRGIEIILATI